MAMSIVTSLATVPTTHVQNFHIIPNGNSTPIKQQPPTTLLPALVAATFLSASGCDPPIRGPHLNLGNVTWQGAGLAHHSICRRGSGLEKVLTGGCCRGPSKRWLLALRPLGCQQMPSLEGRPGLEVQPKSPLPPQHCTPESLPPPQVELTVLRGVTFR